MGQLDPGLGTRSLWAALCLAREQDGSEVFFSDARPRTTCSSLCSATSEAWSVISYASTSCCKMGITTSPTSVG